MNKMKNKILSILAAGSLLIPNAVSVKARENPEQNTSTEPQGTTAQNTEQEITLEIANNMGSGQRAIAYIRLLRRLRDAISNYVSQCSADAYMPLDYFQPIQKQLSYLVIAEFNIPEVTRLSNSQLADFMERSYLHTEIFNSVLRFTNISREARAEALRDIYHNMDNAAAMNDILTRYTRFDAKKNCTPLHYAHITRIFGAR